MTWIRTIIIRNKLCTKWGCMVYCNTGAQCFFQWYFTTVSGNKPVYRWRWSLTASFDIYIFHNVLCSEEKMATGVHINYIHLAKRK